MFAATLFSNVSAGWFLACLLIGLLYAFALYIQKKHQRIHYLLFALRAILVASLCFLLLAPLLKLQKEREEKPLIIVAQDNSASVPLSANKAFNFKSYQEEFQKITSQLDAKYNIELLNFGSGVSVSKTTDFSEQQTDISQLLTHIRNQYGHKNIGALIIASDGIINKGNSGTQYASVSKTPIYTIALGDTSIKKDLLIRNINYNRFAYSGNQYPVEVSLSAYQAKGKTANIRLESTDGQLKTQSFTIDANDWRKSITFYLEAKKAGIQRVNIQLNNIGEEASLQNNQQTIFIEVLDGKQKILLLANAPHPDLNALKQSLDVNKNYETEILVGENTPKNASDYDVIVLHNLPSSDFPLRDFIAKNSHKPLWFITGTATNIALLNQTQNIFQIQNSTSPQDFYPHFNKDFYHFSVSEALAAFLRNQAPLTGSLGKINTGGAIQHLLTQKVGDTYSPQPLLSFIQKNNINYAVLAGEGIWRWRLENYKRNEDFNAFDELIGKTVQFLSVKEDKRKFRAYPAKSRFTEDENIILNAELYNNAYEPIENAEISIELKNNEAKNFSYLFSKKEKFYELNAGLLPSGEYHFVAKTTVGSEKHESKGSFLIEKLHAEYANTRANHQLLYNLSALSGGKMFYPSEIGKLPHELINNEKITTVIYTDDSYEDLINMKWIFAILMLLLSAEWFIRKRNGLL